MSVSNRQLANGIFWGLIILTVVVVLLKAKSYFGVDRTVADKGDIIVYGSKTCPWCVKQEAYLKDKGIDYNFVDCASGQCPEFVSGFPTLLVNGEVKAGYTEV